MGINRLGVVQVALGRPQTDAGTDVLEALDCLRVAITLFDADERLTYCNTHFNFLFRSLPPFATLLGRRYDDLIRLEIAGGEIADAQTIDIDDFIARRRRQLLESDFRPLDIHLSDGRVIEIKARRTSQGGWIVLWSDASYTRNLLTRLEDAIALSVDAFAFWSDSDHLVLCNSAFAELHGVVSPDEACGMSFVELMRHAMGHGKFAIEERFERWFERRLDAHRATAGALTVATRGGEAFLVRERATRGGGSVTVLTDVSEHHRAESALAEQTHALQRTRRALHKSKSEAKKRASYLADLTRRLDAAEAEADTAKSALLRTMSHELKTPLNAIIGFSELLQAAPGRFKPEQVGEYAGMIHTAGGNLLRLINQILDLTRIAAGRYPLQRAPVAVISAFAGIMDLHASRTQAKSLLVDNSGCAHDLYVHADEAALATMIGHLFENALASTPPGGVVQLSATREEGFIRIAVTDNGSGVAAQDLDRILEPFEHADRGYVGRNGGAGLGLPLVRALAELHGGSLAVASELGEGFTATIELPSA
jgi:two-component system, cell cycle sensor histidine kinase PleC